MNKLFKKIKNFIWLINNISKPYYFSFINANLYLKNKDLHLLKQNSFFLNNDFIYEYETNFSKLIGNGKSISFAAARMAFFSLMKVLQIKNNDEVIIQAGNCAVMINAIIRIGAKPIFVDFDINTFGSSAINIENKITRNTKLIVAQHSFGIPCDILEISKLAKKYNIFLLEDCALTLGSKIQNMNVGNIGNAAIFSTDRSKPINTFIGGLLYTNDINLTNSLRDYRDSLPSLSNKHQFNIINSIFFHNKYFNTKKTAQGYFVNYFNQILIFFKIKPQTNIYLLDDGEAINIPYKNYPYPAKFPNFLAYIGLNEIKNFSKTINIRKKIFYRFLEIFQKYNLETLLPNAYFDKSLEIIPLRFVFIVDNKNLMIKLLNKFMDTNNFWFDQPLIACEDPATYYYFDGMCKNVDFATIRIINLPCTFDYAYLPEFAENLDKTLFTFKNLIKND